MTREEHDALEARLLFTDKSITHLVRPGTPDVCVVCGYDEVVSDTRSYGTCWDHPGPGDVNCCDVLGLPNPRRLSEEDE